MICHHNLSLRYSKHEILNIAAFPHFQPNSHRLASFKYSSLPPALFCRTMGPRKNLGAHLQKMISSKHSNYSAQKSDSRASTPTNYHHFVKAIFKQKNPCQTTSFSAFTGKHSFSWHAAFPCNVWWKLQHFWGLLGCHSPSQWYVKILQTGTSFLYYHIYWALHLFPLSSFPWASLAKTSYLEINFKIRSVLHWSLQMSGLSGKTDIKLRHREYSNSYFKVRCCLHDNVKNLLV